MKKIFLYCLLSMLLFACKSETDKAIDTLEKFTEKWYDKAENNSLTPEDKKTIIAEIQSFNEFKNIDRNDYSEEQLKKVSELSDKLLKITGSVAEEMIKNGELKTIF